MNPVWNETVLLADFCQNDIFFGYPASLYLWHFFWFWVSVIVFLEWGDCACVCGREGRGRLKRKKWFILLLSNDHNWWQTHYLFIEWNIAYQRWNITSIVQWLMTRVFAVFWLTGFNGHKRGIKVLHQLKLLTKVLTLMFYYEGVNKNTIESPWFYKKKLLYLR